MTVTSNDIANQAIALIGNNVPPILGQNPTWDGSTAGQALAELYSPAVATAARQFGWDFARHAVSLTLSGNPAPAGWLFEYLYPGTVEVWQLQPPTLADANNPLPVNWNVENNLVSAVQTESDCL